MNETLKTILIIGGFGIIVWLAITFIISAGIVLFILFIIGLTIYGAYHIWEDYAKEELLKKKKILIL